MGALQKRARKAEGRIGFIFTPTSFVLDVPLDVETGEPVVAEEERVWYETFQKDRLAALYQLGFVSKEAGFSPSMRFLHRVASTFILCTVQQPDIEFLRSEATPVYDQETVSSLLLALPFTPGYEHVDQAWIERTFTALSEVFQRDMAAWNGTVEHYVAEKSQDLRVPGRVFFHLVENPRGVDSGLPFAFVATYATQDDADNIKHLPLRYALTEYESDQHKLLELIAGLGRAAQKSTFISELMESGELFHPLQMSASEAYTILSEIPLYEAAGILCRIPDWWRRGASNLKVAVKIGEKGPSLLGAESLMASVPSFTVDGVELSRAEILDLLHQTEGLAFLKGKWINVDHSRLHALLDAFDKAGNTELTVIEALRMQANAEDEDLDGGTLLEVSRGEWLDNLQHRMREPSSITDYQVPATIRATLRPYQQAGFAWLSFMHSLGFGVCLADDMGLGKTVQVLAFIEYLRTKVAGSEHVVVDGEGKDTAVTDGTITKTSTGSNNDNDSNNRPHSSLHALLIVPASLIGNWHHEIEKFAPQLDYMLLYGRTAKSIDAEFATVADSALRTLLPSLTITTYAMAQRIEMIQRMHWDILVLDEAQAIKNPAAKQTKTIKSIPSSMRITMTGTPVENDLSNLWSLFDFMDRGLLGSVKEFKEYAERLSDSPSGYTPLREMISPFILRRMKTDRSIIADLPEKIIMPSYVELTKKQVTLYRKTVTDMAERLNDTNLSPMARSGTVISTLTKLKQICNHPDQYLGQEGFLPAESGKFATLSDICKTVYEKRERVLVFTQFREMCGPLDRLLTAVFERPGLVIHGGISARHRTELVERFQSEEYVPYMVLSLKAGGTGLNLTAANSVIHFDRWWNPAVENQATDRAFRIGQTRDVMVYKLICQDTLEERIDEMIERKSKLLEDVVGSDTKWLGKLTDEELMNLVQLPEMR